MLLYHEKFLEEKLIENFYPQFNIINFFNINIAFIYYQIF